MRKPTPPSDTEHLSNRLIMGGCILLIFPCGFLLFALMFYFLPILGYAITGG